MTRLFALATAAAMLLAANVVAVSPATAQQTIATVTMEPATWPDGTWAKWKAAFLSGGRVVDNGNKNISHSEGQGYGMLLAVLANDRTAFDQMYLWTRTELYIRPDGLAAWKWEPGQQPHITDRNNASDGDLLIAWALVEAAERWSALPYRTDAIRIVTALDKAAGQRSWFGRILLPGVDGFTVDHRQKQGDGPIINPSYWIFPAMERMREIAPSIDWDGYLASGYTVLKETRFGAAGLPTDWVSIAGGKAKPAADFPPTFSYNAVRIPLYLAWARQEPKEALKPFVAYFNANGDRAYEYDVEKQAIAAEMADPGYRAIFFVAKCAVEGASVPPGLRSVSFDRYYSATLHMLALAAARVRFDKCL